MRKLLKRWYIWLALFLLLGLTGSAAIIYSSQSRITQANFGLVQEGMSKRDVEAIFGEAENENSYPGVSSPRSICWWSSGPDLLEVRFEYNRVNSKVLHLARPWETLKWYAKKGAEKIGVKWD